MKREAIGFYDMRDCGHGDVMFRIYDNKGAYRSSRCVSAAEAEHDAAAYQRIGYYPMTVA